MCVRGKGRGLLVGVAGGRPACGVVVGVLPTVDCSSLSVARGKCGIVGGLVAQRECCSMRDQLYGAGKKEANNVVAGGVGRRGMLGVWVAWVGDRRAWWLGMVCKRRGACGGVIWPCGTCLRVRVTVNKSLCSYFQSRSRHGGCASLSPPQNVEATTCPLG